jgi:hypothetical protein
VGFQSAAAAEAERHSRDNYPLITTAAADTKAQLALGYRPGSQRRRHCAPVGWFTWSTIYVSFSPTRCGCPAAAAPAHKSKWAFRLLR